MTGTLSPSRAKAPPRPRTVPPLRAELRRGSGPWIGAVVALTVLLAMYDTAPSWQTRWTDATGLLHAAGGLLGGPLALAAGCWQGGRDGRRGTAELWGSVPRSPLRRLFLAVAPSALWPAAGLLFADLVCLWATRPYVSGGRPLLELLAADVVAVGALGALGHVAGRVLPRRVAAPLLGVVGYVGLGLGTYTESGARWLSPAAEYTNPWAWPVWWFGPVSMAWTAGLALTALLLHGAETAGLRARALVPLALAVTSAVLLLRLPSDEGPWRPAPSLSRAVCDDGVPRVCVTALDRKLLPALSEALHPVNARLRDLPGAPTRWAIGPLDPRPGDVELLEPAQYVVHGRVADPAAYRASAVMQLFSDTCRPDDLGDADAERARAVNSAVVEWLAPAPNGFEPHADSRRPLARLRAKSPTAQRDYLARYLTANRCLPGGVPIP
ncbi:hypothetical protein [Streptomyces sp. NPDC058872]|uniref:hypothetical protein n=1 Tax=Streptomyces sp. NPDC058872 TaxID=3346661 RepID=UPI00368B57C4